MATLATFFKPTSVKRCDAIAAGAERDAVVRAQSDPFRLRALPNDEIFFYAKRIDNSRVVRQQDPSARGECWSAVGAAAVVLMLGASVIAPHVGSVLAGYKLESLKQEHQTLLDQSRELAVREATLLSPNRLHELAKAQNLTSPAADQIIHLENQAREGSFASARAPLSSAEAGR
jgi:hypothetical protein